MHSPCGLPVRYLIWIVAFFGFFLNYAHKAILSVTIVLMSKKINETTGQFINDGDDNAFYWTISDREILTQAFFYGYILTQIPSGILAERWSAKIIFGYSLFFVSILSLIFPIVCKYSFTGAFIIRVAQGFFEGVTYPVMNALIPHWTPKYERNTTLSLVHMGAPIGAVMTFLICGQVSMWYGWQSMYYVLGVFGILWFLCWELVATDFPETHRFISEAELLEIERGIGDERVQMACKIPWKEFIKSPAVISLVIVSATCNWGYLVLLGQLPTYLNKVFNTNVSESSFITAMPFLVECISIGIASSVADKIRSMEIIPITLIRKICNLIGATGCGMCLLCITLVQTSQMWTSIAFMIAFFLYGFTAGGYAIAHIDMSPSFAGTLMGIANFAANIPGILVPQAISLLISDSGNQASQWAVFFTISGTIMITGSFIWTLFGSSELQKWDQSALLISQSQCESDQCDRTDSDSTSTSTTIQLSNNRNEY